MYRFGDELSETTMVTGSYQRFEKDQINMIDDEEHTVIRDPLDIYQTVLENCKKYGSMCIREDYPGWKAGNFKSQFGKLLLLDEADYAT